MKDFKLPKIRKVKPTLFTSSSVKVQPFFIVDVGATYLVRELAPDVWETCTEKDIYDPNYKPFLAIPSRNGYAVWDGLTGKPVKCTDREIFKMYGVSPEDAMVTQKNEVLNDKGHKTYGASILFEHFKTKLCEGLKIPAKYFETYDEFKEEFGEPSKPE